MTSLPDCAAWISAIISFESVPEIGELTEVYREEALMYPGMAELVRDLIEAHGIRVGMVRRNICHEPKTTLARLVGRHDIDLGHLYFMHYLPLREEKTPYSRRRAPSPVVTNTKTTLRPWLPACTHSSCPMASRVTGASP